MESRRRRRRRKLMSAQSMLGRMIHSQILG